MNLFHLADCALIPDQFNNPFRYHPHPLIAEAADGLLDMLKEWSERETDSEEYQIERSMSEGKMLGILLAKDADSNTGFLYGFSGNVAGRSNVEGFVPPIFDLTDPSGEFKKGENELNELTSRINTISNSDIMLSLKQGLKEALQKRDQEIENMKSAIAISRAERNKARQETQEQEKLAQLIKESQHQKAQLKRLKDAWEERICIIRKELDELNKEIETLKKERAGKSDELQKWIFDRYIVHNAQGQKASIREIFAEKGLLPPGGTGECAAPKLLEYAYTHQLTPLAMGEFWYGESPSAAVRTHGRFYPSCTSKCGPLLGFMLKGLQCFSQDSEHIPFNASIYEDESVIVIEKPSGIPSVPGLDGKISLEEMLGNVQAVHRLDMDTSGVMIFAKTESAAVSLKKQFEAHTIKKTYKARLSPQPYSRFTASLIPLDEGCCGSVDLPLSSDYDERPRQKVDPTQGKKALTYFKVERIRKDNSIDVLFFPETGRTHQLRVHSAHNLGLGRPICGDLLYGGSQSYRLNLHASSITFRHPVTDEEMTFTSDELCYK